MCWIWWGIPRLVFLLHYVPLGGRSFYGSGWKWARHVFRVYLSLVSPYRRLIQLNRQNKVFRYLNARLILHMRDPEFKEQIIDVIFQCAAGLNPRGLRSCGNQAFSMLFLLLKMFSKTFCLPVKEWQRCLKLILSQTKRKKRFNF